MYTVLILVIQPCFRFANNKNSYKSPFGLHQPKSLASLASFGADIVMSNLSMVGLTISSNNVIESAFKQDDIELKLK